MKIIKPTIVLIIIILVLITNNILLQTYDVSKALLKFINGGDMNFKENAVLAINVFALITIIYILNKKSSKVSNTKGNQKTDKKQKSKKPQNNTKKKLRSPGTESKTEETSDIINREGEKEEPEPEINEDMEQYLGKSLWVNNFIENEELARNFENENNIMINNKKNKKIKKDSNILKEEMKKKIKRTHDQFQLKFQKNGNKIKTKDSE